MRAVRLRLPVFLLVAALLVGVVAPVASAQSSSKRPASKKTAEQVERARKLDALKASDTQLLQAVKALDKQVAATDASAQSSRQSIRAAEAARKLAQTRLDQAQATMEALRGSLVRRAIEEYKRPQQFGYDTGGTTGSIGDFTRRKALLDQVTNADRDVMDQLHATQQDLVRQRNAAQNAKTLAEARRKSLQNQLAQLLRDRDAKGRLSVALEKRIQEIQAESAALAGDQAAVKNVINSAGTKGSAGASRAGLVWPVRGRLTSGFGYRWGRLHAGIDIGAPKGTPIRSARSGTVIFAGRMSGYGNTVIVDHGAGMTTLYGHQSRLGSRRGQRVNQGQVIGYVGSTGHSTGNHLHFETRINGRPQNPRRYL